MEVGTHHILVCGQTKPPMVPSCGGMGAGQVMEQFQKEIFTRGLEKKVIISNTGCVGICNRGSNVIVYPEGKWYTAVKPEDVSNIVENHIINGNIVTDRNDPDSSVISDEVGMYQERIKMMMSDAGKL